VCQRNANGAYLELILNIRPDKEGIYMRVRTRNDSQTETGLARTICSESTYFKTEGTRFEKIHKLGQWRHVAIQWESPNLVQEKIEVLRLCCVWILALSYSAPAAIEALYGPVRLLQLIAS
jgi:hypothetical protein